jgi:hypothetical protein
MRDSAGVTIEHDFDAAGRSVDIGRGVQWLAEGWELFVKAPGVWVAISAVFMVIIGLLSLVPVIGSVAEAFLTPVLTAGMLAGCRELQAGGTLRFDHLFLGFRGDATGRLVTVGVFSLVGFTAILIVIVLVGGGAAVSGALIGGDGPQFGVAMMGAILLAAALSLALLVPLSMALWFAPALVMFGGLLPGPALKSSFSGCLKNVLPFTVYGVILFVLLIVAALPMLLGFLVLIPVTVGSIHAAYADIFE